MHNFENLLTIGTHFNSKGGTVAKPIAIAVK